MEYEIIIINHLLDKYELSKSFINKNKVNQNFSLKIGSYFKEYEDHANFEVFSQINEAIRFLTKKNLITAKFNKSGICSIVSLNKDNIDEVYLFAQRVSKKDVNNSILSLLEQYQKSNEILNRFCLAQTTRIKENKSIQHYNNDIVEFENILIAIERLFMIKEETFIRDFSVRTFSDSKLFEKISSKVVNIIFEYGDFPEKDLILEELNLVKNPTYVNFKGKGVITINGQRVDLSLLNSDIAISSLDIGHIDDIEVTVGKVISIENLTSFHSAKSSDTFLIYLGGFHNEIRRKFIKKIYQQNPNVSYYHFGDIDAGGFYILNHLKNQTNVDFKPYKMDVETLIIYKDFTKKLTVNDRERLIKLLDSEYHDVIEYMLNNDCKLEQEAIDFKKEL